MKNWYIIQTFSVFEQKVSETLKEQIKRSELTDKIEEVLLGSVMVLILSSIAAIFFLLLDQIYKFFLDLMLTINF